MNLPSLSLSYLRASDRSTLLTIVLFAFGVAAITLLALTARQLEARMSRDALDIDVVVGAQGRAQQLVLGAVYQLDVATPAFPWAHAQALSLRPHVVKAIPLATGDSFQSFPIVGTTQDYVARHSPRLRDGRMWDKPLEVVIGAAVASRTGLRIGSTFNPVHAGNGGADSVHEDHTYTVVGELRRTDTVLDRVIVAALESVWAVHGEPDTVLVAEPRSDDVRPINAVLVQAASKAGARLVMQEVNGIEGLQAVSPAIGANRIFNIASVGIAVLRTLGVLLVAGAGVCVFFALAGALSHRRYDLAIMRALGASPRQIMLLLLFEGMFVAATGAVAGLVLGHLATSVLGMALYSQSVGLTGWTWSAGELWIVLAAIVVGFLAALVPAWRAHETDIATTLARG